MRSNGFTLLAILTLSVALAPNTGATPTIGRTPSAIATDETGAVTINIGNLSGSSAILRLYTDANGNGAIDPGDEAVWTHVIPDNVALWSPAMPSDTDTDEGEITVEVRGFTPFEFPYSAGSFIWEAEDTGDNSKQTATFSVTQAAQAQSVTGTVTNAADMQPIPGALAVLLQFCDAGDEAERLYSVFTNASGQFDIEVPDDLNCYKRVVVAAKPGFVSNLLDQPLLTFTGSSNFTGQDVELTPGTQSVEGSVLYSSGPEVGNGIPGVLLFADSLGLPMVSVAFADQDGDYAFMLTDGEWEISEPEDGLDARGAVAIDAFEEFVVSGGLVMVPDILMPASNAYFQGVVEDRFGSPVGGRFVSADEVSPCTTECSRITTVTDANGLYTLGVRAPGGPAVGEFVLTIEDPLADQVAEQLGCNFASAGDTVGGVTLRHVAPTDFITGTLVDNDGVATPGFCVDAWAPGGGCTSYTSSAVTSCDGSYSLPVVDGSWSVSMEVDDLSSFYGDYSSTSAGRTINLPGDDTDGADFIVGPARFRPHIVAIEPGTAVQSGQRVGIEGYGFSLGTPPTVLFGATVATLADFRPDLGLLFVDVPGGLPAGSVDVTVVNNDLGLTSEAYCLELAAGAFAPACTISGTTTDGGGALGGVTVFALDDTNEQFGGHAASDGSGNYSIGLPTVGDYSVFMAPPEGNSLNWAFYTVICGNPQSHMFSTGFEITGQLLDSNNDAVEGATVQIDDSGSGYFSQVLTDEDGGYLLVAPMGTYDVYFNPPPGSRILQAPGFQFPVSANTDVGQNTASIGSFFAGTVRDASGDGVRAELEAIDTSLMERAGDATSNSCTGRFNVGLPAGQFELAIRDAGTGLFRDSTVKFAEIDGDTIADFGFTVFDDAVNPAQGPEPAILFIEPTAAGQAGQPLVIDASNLGGTTVDVLFSNGSGGFVAGTSTDTEPERGLVVTRIPAGAADGTLKVRVDGVDSDEVPFTRIPGSYPAGAHSVSGTVTGDGSAGAFVALARLDPAASSCDDDAGIVDYTRADGSGNYGPLTHLGGDIEVFVLPDAASAGVSLGEFRGGVASNITVDVAVPTGVAVSARVVDASSNPVPNALLELGDSQRRTDSNGDATVYTTIGDHELTVIPPRRLRLFEYDDLASITMATDLGDLVLDDGSMVSSAVLLESNGTPFGGVSVEGSQSEDPFAFFFETATGADGAFDGPIAADSMFQVVAEPLDDTLSNIRVEETSGPDTDCILHPALAASPAGLIAGLVRDAGSMSPIGDLSVYSLLNDMGVPDDLSGFTRTCDDGTYTLKVAEGSHFLRFEDLENSLYGAWHDDEFCFNLATPVSVTEGNTTTIDVDLAQFGSITGTVRSMGVPVAGATVCTTSVNGGGCQTCSLPTDGSGVYTVAVPPETDYRVEAFTGVGQMCYDGFLSCGGFTPVTVNAGMATTGIDFLFGCTMTDLDGDGVTECAGDCDDFDENNFPGNTETCDGQDNDCDTLVDAADPDVVAATWYADTDLDGYGDAGTTQTTCPAPAGYVADSSDCDDANGDTYPGADEINDGFDNQCPGEPGSGLVDELSGVAGFFNPADKDEFSWPAQGGAAEYKVARSAAPDHSLAGELFTTSGTLWSDPAQPAAGEVSYYVARSLSPFDGSWGQSSSGTERSVNIVVNGNLEDWATANDMTGWVADTTGGVLEQETDPAQVFEGNYAARLTRSASGLLRIRRQDLRLVPGQTYTASFAAKFDRVEPNAVQVRISNNTSGEELQSDGSWAAGANSFNYNLTESYQVFSIPFTVDAGFAPTDDFRIVISHRFGNTIGTVLWLDDILIEER